MTGREATRVIWPLFPNGGSEVTPVTKSLWVQKIRYVVGGASVWYLVGKQQILSRESSDRLTGIYFSQR